MCRMFVTYTVLALVLVSSSYGDNRALLCDMIVQKLGLTFYTSSELQVIVKCVEPQCYATPNNTTAIASKGKTCVLNNSGNKAVQALSLYSNANNCLSPESLDDVVTKLIPPVQALTTTLVKKIKTTLADCKKSNTQTAAAKQETCLQKCYAVAKAAITLTYVDNVCKKVVNQNVTKQEWGCGQKYIPSLLTFSKYNCSKITKA